MVNVTIEFPALRRRQFLDASSAKSVNSASWLISFRASIFGGAIDSSSRVLRIAGATVVRLHASKALVNDQCRRFAAPNLTPFMIAREGDTPR